MLAIFNAIRFKLHVHLAGVDCSGVHDQVELKFASGLQV